MKYVANGKIITEEEANIIRTKNNELLAMAEKTGDLNYLMDATIILPLDIELALANRKGA